MACNCIIILVLILVWPQGTPLPIGVCDCFVRRQCSLRRCDASWLDGMTHFDKVSHLSDLSNRQAWQKWDAKNSVFQLRSWHWLTERQMTTCWFQRDRIYSAIWRGKKGEERAAEEEDGKEQSAHRPWDAHTIFCSSFKIKKKLISGCKFLEKLGLEQCNDNFTQPPADNQQNRASCWTQIKSPLLINGLLRSNDFLPAHMEET